jgi:formate/nitrite transporter FocA (FNT family)
MKFKEGETMSEAREQQQQDEQDEQNEEQKKKGEQREVEERSAPGGRIVYKAILKEGVEELERPSSALFWSGLAAGLSMGFSLVAEGLMVTYLPDTHWRPLVAKFGYSVGFLIVILGRQQLFTENTLTPILPLLNKWDGSTLLNVLRLWAIVLVANLLGAFIFAWAVSRTTAFEPEIQSAFSELGHKAMEPGALTILWRGVFAGWLIALMVWLLPFAETARVWVIIFITYLVGLGHFSHIIAGAVEVFAVAAMNEESWLTVIGHFIAPTLLGNILGGVTLVAALNHAQVVAGGRGEDI